VVASGVENMSRLPIGSDAAAGAKADMGKPISRSYREHFEWTSQFEASERIATKWEIGRQHTDAFGLESQLRAAHAVADGRFIEQIVPVEVDVLDEQEKRTGERRVVDRDEIPRDTSLAALAELKPVARPDGVHTAGTASQIADGASVVVLMSAEAAEKAGVRARARVAASCLVGCDPVFMLEGPIPATERLLDITGLSIDDIDVFEINEAFASIVLSWAQATRADMTRVNPNGGAIALGHPLGATGGFLVTKALYELERGGGRFGLVSMCCGGGLGTGTVLERVGA
jgi:acetyl-CoA C-acetyltransferase